MDDLTSLRAIRRTATGPTDAALDRARTALDERMAAPARGGWFAAFTARLHRPSPLVVTFATIAAVAVVGIIVASVFGSGIRSVRQPAVPAPSPTATATPSPGSQRAFDGDCSTIFSDAEASSLLGSPLTAAAPYTVAEMGAYALPVIMRGGVECSWVASAQKDPTQLYFVVLPTTAKAEDPYCYGSDGAPACSFGTVASGLWISGVAYGPKGSSTKKLISRIGNVESAFVAKAAAQPTVEVFTAPGAWEPPTDCTQLESLAQLAVVTSSPGLTADQGDAPGEAPAGFYQASADANEVGCIWQTSHYPAPDDQVSDLFVTILPGGAFARPQLEAQLGGTPVAIPGTDGAIAVTDEGHTSYTVFAGDNLLTISGNAPVASLRLAASALVKTLDATIGG